MTRASKPSRSKEVKVVQGAIAAIEAVPAWDPWDKQRPPEVRGARAAALKQLHDRLVLVLATLERLQAETIPEALITSPCGASRNPAAVRTPIHNLLHCHDACALCTEEAKRALRLVLRALSGEVVAGMFLPAAVIAARIIAAQAHEDRSERGRAQAHTWAVIPIEENDGTVSMVRNDPARPHVRDDVPRSMYSVRDHLITQADLAHFASINRLGVPTQSRHMKALLPRAVWLKSGHRSLYRFGRALAAMGRVAEHKDRFEQLVVTDWLREHLHPPDYRPPWAKRVKPSA